MAHKDGSLSGANQFTDWITIRGHKKRDFTLMIAGTFAGTITLQMRRTNSGDIVDLDTFTDATVKNGDMVGGFDIRAGFKSGEYTSGTAEVTISAED